MKVTETIGNRELWDWNKTLFLCSKYAPFSCYENVFQWVEGFSPCVSEARKETYECVVCFNTSELEEEVFKTLLVCRVPTVLLMTKRFSDNYNVQIDRALKENRLLIMTLHREEIDGKGNIVPVRNRFAIDHAKQIVCGPINPTGINYNLLHGRSNVTYLVGQKMPMAAEDEPKSRNWTVGEVKCLLRMYYEDMGIHAIHKAVGRSYSSVYNRIKSLTMCDDMLKGREFENYVLSLLDIPHDKSITLLVWRGDKSLPGVYPENNSAPDFVFECRGRRFAVECKWRNHIPRTIDKELLSPERQRFFLQYSEKHAMPVFLLLGIGGLPSEPAELFLVQVDSKLTIAAMRRCMVPPNELKERLCKVQAPV